MADATAVRAHLIAHADAIMAETERLMSDALREAAPYATGETRRGIESIPGGSATRPAFTLRSTADGGDYVEKGTRPHTIPRGGAQPGITLRWVDKSGRFATRAGGVVFRKVVNHPGTPARPWFRPVTERFGEFLARASAVVR